MPVSVYICLYLLLIPRSKMVTLVTLVDISKLPRRELPSATGCVCVFVSGGPEEQWRVGARESTVRSSLHPCQGWVPAAKHCLWGKHQTLTEHVMRQARGAGGSLPDVGHRKTCPRTERAFDPTEISSDFSWLLRPDSLHLGSLLQPVFLLTAPLFSCRLD